jgi:succinoglycan biosynthesis protein ExoA
VDDCQPSGSSAAETDRPRVTVIMPVRNEGAFIARSLGAVLHQDYPSGGMEIIVVDGMSDDGTVERLRELGAGHPELTVLANPGRIVPTGLNLALARARGEVVVRVDGHCEVAPDYVRRCVERLREGVWAGVGGVVETVGETAPARAIALAMSVPFGVGGGNFRTIASRREDVDTVAFAAYPRPVLDRVGPFDEELVRNQDDEYNFRVRRAGGRLLLAPDIRSRYFSRASLGSLWRQYLQYGYWKVRVMQKHPRQMRARHFVPGALVAGVGLAWLLLAAGRSGVWLPAAVSGAYALANLACSLAAARRDRRTLWVLPGAFAAMHFAYGLGFLWGMLRFVGRWGDRTTLVAGRRVAAGGRLS